MMKHPKLTEHARRFLVLLLTAALVVTSLPTSAIAEALPSLDSAFTAARESVGGEGGVGGAADATTAAPAGEGGAAADPTASNLAAPADSPREGTAERKGEAEDGSALAASNPTEGDGPAGTLEDGALSDEPAGSADIEGQKPSGAQGSAPSDSGQQGSAPSAHTAQAQPGDEESANQDDAQDVDDAPAPVKADDAVDGSKLDKAKLVEAPELNDEERAQLMPELFETNGSPKARAAVLAANRDENTPSEGDGNEIELVDVEWIAEPDSQRLTVAPKDDTLQNVRMRVNVAFSGQNDYEPGKLRITVPKDIFTYRDGTPAGTMSTSVPEAPDEHALFSYAELDDAYVLTNTRKLSAATTAMFEFTVHDVVPHKMVGNPDAPGAVSSPFWATANILTPKGTLLGMTSDEIDAVFDTQEVIDTATTTVKLITESWDYTWPASFMPAHEEDYVYADFYSWATVKGNQEFKLEVEHAPTLDGTPIELLGMRDQNGNTYKPDPSADGHAWTLQESGYEKDGTRGFFVHAYAAVPKDEVPEGGTYTFKDAVTYRLTSVDDGQTTSKQATAEQDYSPLAFVNPGGHFNVFKSGSVAHTEDGERLQWGLPDPVGLNELRSGNGIQSTWEVLTIAFNGIHTAKDGNPQTVDDLEQVPVRSVTDDYSVQFNHSGTDLGPDAFEFTSMRLSQPQIFKFEKFERTANGYAANEQGHIEWREIPAGSFGYAQNEDASQIPPIEIWGKTAGATEWTQLATVGWRDGKPVLAQAADGVTLGGVTVMFPKDGGLTDVRTVVDTPRAGVMYAAYPTVSLKATEDVKRQVEELYANSTSPSTVLRNTASMKAYNSEGKQVFSSQEKSADNEISGASMGVRATKELTFENDPANQVASLHYTTTVKEQTNLTSKILYDYAVERGIVLPETSGTFYDLLPEGVVPNLNSIKLREGDALQDVYTIRNYKNSGRTLLVVKASLRPQPTYVAEAQSITGEAGYCDAPRMEFDATYTWEKLSYLGAELNNVIAFESGNPELGNMKGFSGEPDDPTAGNNESSAPAVDGVADIMTNLDDKRDDPSFVYANCVKKVVVDVSAAAGLDKQVSVNGSGVYGTGQGEYAMNVYEGGLYEYRLRMANGAETRLEDIVFFDDLENYVPTEDSEGDYGDKTWRGELLEVDTSQLELMGIDPVVYYSTKDDLDLENPDFIVDDKLAGDLNLRDDDVWSTVMPRDRSMITGIAVDCGTGADGRPFVLPAESTLNVYVRMKAPFAQDLAQGGDKVAWYDTALEDGQAEGDDGGFAGGAHAYNCVSYVGRNADGNDTELKLTHKDYVKVGLLNGDIVVKKAWDDANNQDGMRPDSVTVQLLANGQPIDGASVTLSKSNGWMHTFGGMPRVDAAGNQIAYGLIESPVAEGYVYSVSWEDGKTPADPLTGTVTNIHVPETIEISGVKTWDDANDAAGKRPAKVKIDLYKNGEKHASKTISANETGEWAYSFTGLEKYKGGRDEGGNRELNVYEVREDTYYEGYVPTVTPNETGGFDIRNAYRPYGSLQISKEVLNATPMSADTPFTFRVEFETLDGEPDGDAYAYRIVDSGNADDAGQDDVVGEGAITSGGAIALTGGQTAVIEGIPSETTYSVTEEGAAGFTQTGRVGDSGSIQAGRTAEAEFTNTYATYGTARLRATKVLEGRDLEPYQFHFELLDKDHKLVLTASNDANGNVAFGTLRYDGDDLGKDGTAEVRYFIRERTTDTGLSNAYEFDGAEHAVTVKLTDLGNGKIDANVVYEHGKQPTFTNTYKAAGEMQLRAWKELAGGELADYDFTFELLDEDGKRVGDVVKSDANGVIEFDPIPFTQDDIGEEYTYTAREVVPENAADDPVVYDPAEFTYTVRVVDNGDGTLSFEQTSDETPVFENGLKPGDLRIEKRILNGNPAQQFTFHVELVAPEGVELPKDGEITYERVPLDAAAVEQDANGDMREIEDSEAGNAMSTHEGAIRSTAPASTSSASAETAVASRANTSQSGGNDRPASNLKQAAPAADDDGAADEPVEFLSEEGATVVKSGTVGDGTASWVYYDNGLLVIKDGVINTARYLLPEEDKALRDEALEVRFDNVKIKNMANMLSGFIYGSPKVEKVYGTLDTSECTSMLYAFRMARHLEYVDVSGWDTSKVTTMQGMFGNCVNLVNLDLSSFDTESVTNMGDMFVSCASLATVKLGEKFNTTNVTDMSGMFANCSLAPFDLAKFDTSNVEYMGSMFSGCPDKTIDLSWLDTSNAVTMSYMFSETPFTSIDLSKLDTSNVKNMGGMFSSCSNLAAVDFSGLNTGKVSNMSEVFQGCDRLTSVNLSGLETGNVTKMDFMFDSCPSLLSVDLSDLDLGAVKSMSHLFAGCSALESVKMPTENIPSPTNMTLMFQDCASLTSLSFAGFNISDQTNLVGLLEGCESLRYLDLSRVNASTSDSKNREILPAFLAWPCEITFGSGWNFGASTKMPVPDTSSGAYTGKWVRKDDATAVYTSEQLAEQWTADMAGTYVWQKSDTAYTVAFDANVADDGEVVGSMPALDWGLGVSNPIPACSFRRHGYDFVAWNTQPDGSGETYAAGQVLANGFATQAGATVTLYAQWKESVGTALVENGAFDVTLYGNEAAVITGLPAGVGYTVIEQPVDGWSQLGSSGAAGTIEPMGDKTVAFENIFNPKPQKFTVQLHASKTLDGYPVQEGAFEFQLIEMRKDYDGVLKEQVLQTVRNKDGGAVEFAPISSFISFDDAGGLKTDTYEYIVREVERSDEHPDVIFDQHDEHVTVKLKLDDSTGLLTVDTVYDSEDSTPGKAVFNNAMKLGSLAVTKQVAGATPAGSDATFQFRVDWNGGKTSDVFTLAAGETKTFADLTPGTTYAVTEVGMPGGYTHTGTVDDGRGVIVAAKTANVTVTNAYTAQGSAVIQARKVLEGGALQAGQFAFELTDGGGDVVSTATNGSDGTVAFDALTYTAPGTYRYTISEREPAAAEGIEYDDTKHPVTVEVTDDGNGSLSTKVTYGGTDGAAASADSPVFVNKVAPQGKLVISKKVVGGTDVTKDAAFTFIVKLMDIDGKVLAGTYEFGKSDGSTGTLRSGDTVTLKDAESVTIAVPVGTKYEVTEAEVAGFTSSADAPAGQVVSADAPASVAFTNTYNAVGSFAPKATKKLNSGMLKLRDGQFAFSLYDEDGVLVETVSNDADGNVEFTPIEYTAEDHGKDFTYRMVEVNDHQPNVAYDEREVVVSVHVTDNGDGTMNAAATYDGEADVTFTNRQAVPVPETGRAGIAVGVAMGLALVCVSGYVLLRRRKR